MFGNNNNNQQQQTAPTNGLFGNATPNNPSLFPASSGGLFGSNNNPNSGSGTASGGLFGQKPPNSSTSLFANKDGAGTQTTNNFSNLTSGGLFGSSTPASGFSFANNNTNNNNNSSLFGLNNPLQNTNNQQNLNSSLFQSQQNNQQMLQAHVDQGAYGHNPIFANHGNSGGSKPAIPMKKHLPTIDFKPMPRPNTKITKLRGFARSTSPAKSVNMGSPMAASIATPNMSTTVSRSSAYNRPSEEPLLSPKAFIIRPSPKKLTIDPNTLSSMLRDRSATLNGSPAPQNGTPPPKASQKAMNPTVFDPDAEVSAHHTFSKTQTGLNPSNTAREPAVKASKGTGAPSSKSSMHTATAQPATPESSKADKSATLDELSGIDDVIVVTTKDKAKPGEYWTVPSIRDLQLLGREDLESVPSFLVGRKGIGQIMFQDDVDLTGIPNLEEDLCGEVIVFKQSLCSVYPDDPVDKPPVGEGLNVPAAITLENCWTLDKATREPIKDPNHPRVKQFKKRLMKSEDTQFIEYNAQTGKWTFMVEHFTTYGIDDSDEQSDDDYGATGEGVHSIAEDGYSDSDQSVHVQKAVRPKKGVKLPRPDQELSEEENGPPQTMLFDDEDDESISCDRQVLEDTGGSDQSEDSFQELDAESTSSITGSDGDDILVNPLGRKRPREVSDSAEESQQQLEAIPHSQNWRAQLGVESKKVAVMQASLFAGTVPSYNKTKTLPAVYQSHRAYQDNRTSTRQPGQYLSEPSLVVPAGPRNEVVRKVFTNSGLRLPSFLMLHPSLCLVFASW